MTKIGSSLPKGDANGLAVIAPRLLARPHEVHVVIALVDCKKTTVDHDAGDPEPTARIRRIEVVMPQDHQIAQTILRRSLEHRTGQTVLPYDLEQDILAAFGGIDKATGELFNDGDHDQ